MTDIHAVLFDVGVSRPLDAFHVYEACATLPERGQGIGTMTRTESTTVLVARLDAEYRAAREAL
jgi:hypothetical protein